jgi:hypothetical protein
MTRIRWNVVRAAVLPVCAALAAAAPVAARQAAAPSPAAAPSELATLQTAAERTGHRETTRYADVMTFVERAVAASPLLHLTTFGYTLEGRALPLVVVGRVADASPAAVRAAGRTVLYLQGNIHAGEVEGKEVLLMLLREFAQGRHIALLDSLVLLVAPIYNADGNERVLLTNRPLQHGPIGGMGQRPNAQGLDLNRDHMKLVSPEARSLAVMLNRYDPHVGVDLHTTNGTRHAYHLTYSPPLHPNTDPAIMALLRERWLPEMTRRIREQRGWHYYYYGNVQGEGEARGWYTFDHRPRFNNNYIGLRNRIAILSEAYSYVTFEDRILATRYFVDEILRFAHANAGAIRSVVAEADARPPIGETLAVRATFERSAEPVEILMGDVVAERNPYSGLPMLRRLDVVRPERMYEYGTFRATGSERVPREYLVPAALTRVLDVLRDHGVRMQPLGADEPAAAVERFRVTSMRLADREFQGHRERSVEGAWEAARVALSANTVVVPLDQPLARLIFMLLEPRSDDGLVNWNYFDDVLESADAYPVLKR